MIRRRWYEQILHKRGKGFAGQGAFTHPRCGADGRGRAGAAAVRALLGLDERTGGFAHQHRFSCMAVQLNQHAGNVPGGFRHAQCILNTKKQAGCRIPAGPPVYF